MPGSPVVAERTVELPARARRRRDHLRARRLGDRRGLRALGRDPMAAGLRVVDALATTEPLRGPGPLLVLQTYSPEVLAMVADAPTRRPSP